MLLMFVKIIDHARKPFFFICNKSVNLFYLVKQSWTLNYPAETRSESAFQCAVASFSPKWTKSQIFPLFQERDFSFVLIKTEKKFSFKEITLSELMSQNNKYKTLVKKMYKKKKSQKQWIAASVFEALINLV